MSRIARPAVSAAGRLLRHDRLVVANELRAAFATPGDRVLLLAGTLILLCTAGATLGGRPLAVGVAAAVSGAGLGLAIVRRLAFHAGDGALARDVLIPGAGRRYAAALHVLAAVTIAAGAAAIDPATVVPASSGYVLGAAAAHLLTGAPTIAVRPWSGAARRAGAATRTPAAGIVAGAVIVAPLLFPQVIASPARIPVTALLAVLLAFALTSVDARIVRFMTIAGYPVARILRHHARGVLPAMLVAIPLAAVLAPVGAIVIGGVGLLALALLTARICAYRIHGKRAADVVVGVCAAVAGLAAVAAPVLLPVVVVAILSHLYRRAAAETWLLA